MLSTLPARERNNPKNWKTMILIGLIILLSMALSGLAALYYTNILTANPDVIIINQSADNNSTNGTAVVTKVTNSTKVDDKDKNQSNEQVNKNQKKENANTDKNSNSKNSSS